MCARTPPVRFAFVTGHEFGEAAFNGILSAGTYGSDLQCCLFLCLDETESAATVGYRDAGAPARERGIRVEYIKSIKGETTADLLRQVAPDFLLIIGWSELAPPCILDIPKVIHDGIYRHSAAYGCIGIHPSLLPEGRGRAPIPWAIIKGLDRTGVTAFLLEEGPDSGGIVDQVEIPLEAEETATTLFAKVRGVHQEIGIRLGHLMATRTLHWRSQDESIASVWSRRRPEDGEINFGTPSEAIDRLVRALTSPYPGAFFMYRSVKVQVHRVRLVPDARPGPVGTILGVDGRKPIIASRDGAIRLEGYEPADIVFQPGTRIDRTNG